MEINAYNATYIMESRRSGSTTTTWLITPQTDEDALALAKLHVKRTDDRVLLYKCIYDSRNQVVMHE